MATVEAKDFEYVVRSPVDTGWNGTLKELVSFSCHIKNIY